MVNGGLGGWGGRKVEYTLFRLRSACFISASVLPACVGGSGGGGGVAAPSPPAGSSLSWMLSPADIAVGSVSELAFGVATSALEWSAAVDWVSGLAFFFRCLVILEEGLTPFNLRPPAMAAL